VSLRLSADEDAVALRLEGHFHRVGPWLPTVDDRASTIGCFDVHDSMLRYVGRQGNRLGERAVAQTARGQPRVSEDAEAEE
jgi:hypothetical protein